MDTPLPARSRTWAFLPTACAIHCVLTPLLVAVLPIMQFGEVVEPGFLAVSVLIGAVESRSGYRVHNRLAVALMVFAGVLVWLGSLLGLFLPWLPEPVTSAAGGLTIAAALYWNGRLRHTKECKTECSCPAPH